MRDVLTLLFALVMILAPIAALLLIVRFSSRWLTRNKPKSRLMAKIGPEQAVQSVLAVSLLSLIALVRAFEPATAIGRFLNSPVGLIIALVCATLFATVLGVGVTFLGRRLRQKHRGGV